jgi:copper chaperone
MTTQVLEIGGMTCGHCLMAVRNSLSQVEGLTIAELRVGRAKVAFDPAVVAPGAAEAAVRDAGYSVLGSFEE